MRKFNRWILSLCRIGMIVIVPTMTIIIFIQVILRYGFQNSLSWVDELARYLLVWLTSLGSVYASAKGMHVSVEVLRAKLKGKAGVAVILISQVAVLLFFGLGAWQGAQYALGGWIQRSASLNLHMTYVYAAIPVSFGLMVFTQTECFITELKLALSGKTPGPETDPSDA